MFTRKFVRSAQCPLRPLFQNKQRDDPRPPDFPTFVQGMAGLTSESFLPITHTLLAIRNLNVRKGLTSQSGTPSRVEKKPNWVQLTMMGLRNHISYHVQPRARHNIFSKLFENYFNDNYILVGHKCIYFTLAIEQNIISLAIFFFMRIVHCTVEET